MAQIGCKAAPAGTIDEPVVWPSCGVPPELEAGEVHLWAVSLDLTPGARAKLLPPLAEDERERAQRLVGPAARARFAAARGALRRLLGAYASAAPGSLTFGVADGGKPFLANATWLRFNLAHSGALALVGVARDVELGVDLERRRPVADAVALAARYLAPEEARALATLPVNSHSEAFLRCWTLKEAVLKATGEGLSRALDSFRVAVPFDQPSCLLDLAGPDGSTATWSLHALVPAPAFLGALAVQSPACRLRCFTLSLGEGRPAGSA